MTELRGDTPDQTPEAPAEASPTAPPTEQAREKSVEELERETEETRQRLGETVDALAEKVDVRQRAKQTVGELRERLPGGDAGEGGPAELGKGAASTLRGAVERQPLGAALGALAAGLVLGRLLSRR